MTRSITIACFATLLTIPAASTVIARAQTGIGGGPTSTVTAPNTSSVGRVMPPREARNDPVRGLCIGCGAK